MLSTPAFLEDKAEQPEGSLCSERWGDSASLELTVVGQQATPLNSFTYLGERESTHTSHARTHRRTHTGPEGLRLFFIFRGIRCTAEWF